MDNYSSKIQDLIDRLSECPSTSPLAEANLHATAAFLNNGIPAGQLHLSRHTTGLEIVTEGRASQGLPSGLDYTFVPLGLILEGEVIVHKGGKATKKLVAGDFIGLFETSDWLATKRCREIGRWTLVANTEVEVLYFSSAALDSESAVDFRSYLLDKAREDHVPQPTTTLPLLDWVAGHTTKGRLEKCAIVAHTHLLPNNLPFFRHLAYLVEPNAIFVLEKPYSAVKQAHDSLIHSGCEIVQVRMEPGMPYEFSVQKSLNILWSKVIEEQKRSGFDKLLLIDDGADLWHSIPWDKLQGAKIAGVEQTQRGITRIVDSSVKIPPIVSVASSGIKKILESIFIGRSVVTKLQELGQIAGQTRVGILGMGSIGQAIATSLKQDDIAVTFYDPNEENYSNIADREPSLDSLITRCDLIIGTTGRDGLKGIPYERINGHKVFASASSADVEFASLLMLADPTAEPFSTRHLDVHGNLTIDILNGGYPINFDREKDATPDEDIVLTRCLMYIGAMQAARIMEEENPEGAIYNLDRVSQRKLLELWIADKDKSEDKSPITADEIDNIIDQSFLDNSLDSPSIWID